MLIAEANLSKISASNDIYERREFVFTLKKVLWTMGKNAFELISP